MKKITLILSFLVVAIASAFAQTEYTLDMACQLTDTDPEVHVNPRGRCLIFKATENPNLEFTLTMDEYLMSNHPKIVSNGSDKDKDITITAPEGYEITACSFSFVSTASKATATVYLGNDKKSTNSTNTPETVVGDFSSNPANTVDFIMTSTYTISGFHGITIKDIKVTVKSTQVEGGDNEGEGDGGEGEGGDNGDGNEGEGGDNGDGNEGEGGDNEGEGGDNEGEGDNNEGDNNEGDNNEEGEDTSINDVEVETSQTIYDLTGRRVNEITKAGIYIINGKKVLVK